MSIKRKSFQNPKYGKFRLFSWIFLLDNSLASYENSVFYEITQSKFIIEILGYFEAFLEEYAESKVFSKLLVEGILTQKIDQSVLNRREGVPTARYASVTRVKNNFRTVFQR